MILGLRVPHPEAPQQPGLPDPRGVCGELCALRLRFAPSPGAQLGGPCGACRGRYRTAEKPAGFPLEPRAAQFWDTRHLARRRHLKSS